MDLEARSSPPAAGRDPALWAGVLGGPVAWFVQFQVAYSLAPGACAGSGRLSLHLASLIGLVIASGGVMLAWSSYRRAGPDGPSVAGGGPSARVRFLASLGLMGGPLFSLVILAQWLAIALLDPCPP